MKKIRRFFLLLALSSAWFGFQAPVAAHAESTMSCPSGTYDMLDWMTLDSDLRGGQHLSGSANPIYTNMQGNKFYWTKGGNGSPWDIQLYDSHYVYLWITELVWNSPTTFKKFHGNFNEPLVPRCAKAGTPGSQIYVPDTSYDIYTSCHNYTTHSLKKGVNQVWGPYTMSFGGNLPGNLPTLVISYRYNCDASYGNCGDKEEFYLTQRYGLVQWVHYALVKGTYQQQQKSVFNTLKGGGTTPNFPCF